MVKDAVSMELERDQRLIKSCCIVGALLVSLCVVLPWSFTLLRPGDNLIKNPSVVDDSFYYFKTARYLARTGNATFDGLNKTNGFHPLWMLVNVAVWIALPDNVSSFAAWQVFSLLKLGFLLLTYGLCIWLFWRLLGPWPAVCAVSMLAYFRHTNLVLYGMESTINIALGLVMAVSFSGYLLKSHAPGVVLRSTSLGVLIGLWGLARLDNLLAFPWILLILFVGLLVAGQSRKRSFLMATGVLSIGTVVVLPYLIWNVVVHHHLMPISGMIKGSFYNPGINLAYISFYKDHFILLIGTAVIIGYGLCKAGGGSKISNTTALTFGAAAVLMGGVMTGFYTVVFTRTSAGGWYFGTQCTAVLMATALAAYWLKLPLQAKLGKGAFASICVLLPLLAGCQYLGYLNYRMKEMPNGISAGFYRAALWIKEHIEEDAVLAGTDVGLIGYFSDRTVINLDGLINSYEFYEYLKRHQRDEFLVKEKADYLIGVGQCVGNLSRFAPPYEYSFPDTHVVTHEDEIWRSDTFVHDVGKPAMVTVWKFHR